MKYLVEFALALVLVQSCLSAKPPVAVKMPEKHLAFIDQHCMECHDRDTEKGDFNIEELPLEINSIKIAEMWKHVLNSINAGEMPPEDEPQPKPKEKADFLNDLSEVMVEARSALSDSGGVITMRRLNRREYVNSIRDLLGVTVNAQELPDDQSAFGFDTSGKSLFMSSDQFEKYLNLGEEAISKVLEIPQIKPQVQNLNFEVEKTYYKSVIAQQARQMDIYERAMTWKNNQHESPTKYGFVDEERLEFELMIYHERAHTNSRYMTLTKAADGAYLCLFTPVQNVGVRIPRNYESGKYLLKVEVGLLDKESEFQFIEFGKGEKKDFDVRGSRKVTAMINKPQVMVFQIDHQKGDNTLYGVRQRVPNNFQKVKRLFMNQVENTGLGHKPNIWVDHMQIEGPIYDSWPPENYKQLFPPSKNKWKDGSYAKKVIRNFASRAFRGRPVSEDYVKSLFSIYQKEKSKNKNFKDAIVKPLALILSSPSFLYIPEPTEVKPKNRPLTDRELAVRLSYFLWSSAPDQKLMELALNGRLKDPRVLSQQVNRMLIDDRAYAFISAFCDQWLHMERLNFFQFNARKYYDFDESAKHSARHEVYRTFQTIMEERLGLDKLLKSDFVVIDELLASYYGIDGVRGTGFQKIKLPAGSKRGGLLGMAAVLAMGSDGENSSPVERGAWILRKLLNDPPPPAPPNVPPLEKVSKGLTKREMLTMHTEEPQCAQCHRKIDPLGFGLENFNAAGKWIEHEMVQTQVLDKAKKVKGKSNYKTVNNKRVINASGKMYKGPQFKNYDELRNIIAKQKVAFATGFVEHLIEYALGRPYGFTDNNLREKIVNDAKLNDFDIDRMIQMLVASKEFRSK